MTTEPSANRRSRKSSEMAARIAGASGRTTERVRTVARYMPELLPKIEAGEITAHAAYEYTRRVIALVAAQSDQAGEPLNLGPRSRINEPRPALPRCPHCDGTGLLRPDDH